MDLSWSQVIVAGAIALATIVTFIVEKMRRENRRDHSQVILKLDDIYSDVKETRSDVKNVQREIGDVRDRLWDHLEEHRKDI